MKIMEYTAVEPTHFDNEVAKGVAGRVLVGKADGAQNFCMRAFEIAPGGHTPRHAHAWEHEMFFHTGEGEVYGNGQWNPVGAGCVAFVPGNSEHQIRNTGEKPLTVVCLVPSGAPEL
ncbi:cupin domain-containing protein [Fundidesulfovibrio soli]|uniref:cupin domain-containing protein n=1 Tax=Fundidesulfovibrio soli TaxID=2922716 RepID=UPI001FAF567F|nr:cupin domain-containing protein [Fundidesulfovibrio soli]